MEDWFSVITDKWTWSPHIPQFSTNNKLDYCIEDCGVACVSSSNPLAAEFIYLATSAECSEPIYRPTAVIGLKSHIAASPNFCALQSAYRAAHSTQALLAMIFDDIFQSVDWGSIVALSASISPWPSIRWITRHYWSGFSQSSMSLTLHSAGLNHIFLVDHCSSVSVRPALMSHKGPFLDLSYLQHRWASLSIVMASTVTNMPMTHNFTPPSSNHPETIFNISNLAKPAVKSVSGRTTFSWTKTSRRFVSSVRDRNCQERCYP